MSAFNCPGCGKTTGGNEKFCIECGHPLNTVCTECGETWRFMFDYNFCPACGQKVKKAIAEIHETDVVKVKGNKVTK